MKRNLVKRELKYRLTDDTKRIGKHILHRIQALREVPLRSCMATAAVKKGDLGGWIESEDNLSQEGSCWITDEAMAYGNGKVTGDAYICEHAKVYGNANVNRDAFISGSASVSDYALVTDGAIVIETASVRGSTLISGQSCVSAGASVSGSACVTGESRVSGRARICGTAVITGYAELCGDDRVCRSDEYTVFKNTWSSFRHFTYCITSGQWHACCFNGTGKELVKKAKMDSPISGKMYGKYVRFAEKVLQGRKK